MLQCNGNLAPEKKKKKKKNSQTAGTIFLCTVNIYKITECHAIGF